jgi:hypothetical protein
MFGRFNEVDDKPDWREKLAEWRASPLWVPKRPDWMAEGPGVLALLFLGIGSLMLAIVYVAIPPTALPANLPGHFAVASAATTTSTLTTTTTVPKAQLTKELQRVKGLSPDQQKAFWSWVQAVNKVNHDQAVQDAILAQPIKPPSRRWSYAFLTGVLSAVLFAGAWHFSDARGRAIFSH